MGESIRLHPAPEESGLTREFLRVRDKGKNPSESWAQTRTSGDPSVARYEALDHNELPVYLEDLTEDDIEQILFRAAAGNNTYVAIHCATKAFRPGNKAITPEVNGVLEDFGEEYFGPMMDSDMIGPFRGIIAKDGSRVGFLIALYPISAVPPEEEDEVMEEIDRAVQSEIAYAESL